MRGGGGNFGIVTSFEFTLHPMQRQVVAGAITYPIARAREALMLFGEYCQEAPDELALGLAMVQPPGGEPGVVLFEVCYSGPESGAERALAPLLKLGTPLNDGTKKIDYVVVQRSGDVTDPRAMSMYVKSGFISSLGSDLASAIVERFAGDPRRLTSVFFQQSGGAIGRVAPDATAFSQRDIMANMLSAVGWRFGDDQTEHVAWIKEYWKGLEPFTHGFYVNDLELDTTGAAVQANYRQNHDRLVAVKNTYDPANLFRLNANVKPTVAKH